MRAATPQLGFGLLSLVVLSGYLLSLTLAPRPAAAAFRPEAAPQLLGVDVRQEEGWRRHPGPRVRLLAPLGQRVPVESVVRLEFTEPMDEESVETAFETSPRLSGSFSWPDPQTLIFRPTALEYRTAYELRVSGLSEDGRALAGPRSFRFSTGWPEPAVPRPFTLTFDDCGSPEAIQGILGILAERGLSAVFFPTGLCRDQYPWLVPALLAGGHRVCNHTYSHPVLTRLSSPAIRAEIAAGVSVGCDLFRPPYGAVDARMYAIAASLGYRVQLWDVDTRDWAGTGAAEMVAMIRARGGVVLMHMHGLHTLEALQML